MFEFKLPDLGEGIQEGEILHWHVAVGDRIKEDDPLVEVETDKAAVTIPSPKGGKIVSLTGDVGQLVAVGTVIVVIDESGAEDSAQTGTTPAADERSTAEEPAAKKAAERAPDKGAERTPGKAAERAAGRAPDKGAERAPGKAVERAAERAPTAAAAKEAAQKAPADEKAPEPAPSGARTPVPAAPATRRLARELDVDLARVPASGPGGRVTSEDVQRFAAGKTDGSAEAAAPAGGERDRSPAEEEVAQPSVSAGGGAGVPFFELERLPDFEQWGPVQREAVRSIRRKVARKMVASMTIVPHVAHMDEADVTDLDAFRRRERKRLEGQEGGRLTLLAFVIKAAVAQLKARPQFNASLDPHRQEIVYKKYFNVGFAADTDKGLVVPVVKDVDRKNIVELSAEIERLATRAREGKLEVDDLRGGTFTVTNVGSLGGTGVIPTINYPEVAILGMGLAQDKPVARDGQVVVRKMLPLTIAFDHRLIDGADAARWMTSLVRALSDPYAWIMEC